jgi:hypothetical protein
MPGASTVKAGRAWWEITAEDKASKVIEAVSERLESIGRTTMVAGAAIAAAGAAIVGPVLAAAQSWSDYAGDLEDASIRTGLSVESLSTLQLAAEEGGASAEALTKGLIGVAKFADAVGKGSKEATAALDQMGLSASTFLAASPDERVKLLADGIARIPDPSKRATTAMKAFGKAGIELLPMLAQGGAGIAAMQQQFADLGLAVPSKDIGMFAAWGDAMAVIGKQLKRIWQEFGAALIEAVTPFVPVITSALAAAIEFAQNNRGLIKIVLAVGAALVTVGTAVFGVGAALAAAGAIISGIGSALIAIGPIVAAISAAFTFLAGPVGLAILAVAAVISVVTALGVAFVQLTDTGARAWSALTKGIMGVWQRFKEVIGGIADALLAGEWGLAVDIAWAGVMLVFEHNVAAVYSIVAGMISGVADMFFGLVDTIRQVGSMMMEGLSATATFIGDLFAEAVGLISEAFLGLVGTVQSVGGSIVSTITSAFASVGETISGLFSSIYDVIASFGSSIADPILSGLAIIGDGIAAVFGADIFSSILDFFRGLADGLIGPFRSAFDYIASGLEYIFGADGAQADAKKSLEDLAEGIKQSGAEGVKAQRKELDALIEQAAKAREASKQRFDFSRKSMPDISGTTAADSEAPAAMKPQAGILGTFSATVAGMLGTMRPDVMEAIAENTGKAAETLDRIEDKMAEGGLEFE